MTKNSSSTLFSRPRERRRLLQSSRGLYQDVSYSQLVTYQDDDSEEELFSLNELLPRGHRQPENIIERNLQPGDTLQSISLQYHVPVAELKRLNNIHRENEIHAHSVLRIPIKPISCLVELNPAPVHKEIKTPPRTVSIGSGCDPQEFLAAMDRDLAKIRATIPTAGQSNAPSEICFNALEPAKDASSCSGSDWGLQWQQILICSLVLTFILPIFIWLTHHQDETTQSDKVIMNVTHESAV